MSFDVKCNTASLAAVGPGLDVKDKLSIHDTLFSDARDFGLKLPKSLA